MKPQMMKTTPLRSTHLTDDPVPTRILLAPWGDVESTNGTFRVDEQSARLVIDAFTEHGTDLPIDYEHQTLGGPYASPTGQAPAAGWIKQIQAQPGVGLIGEIEWTPNGRERISAREYRYLSPVALVRAKDQRLVAIHSAALTNKPAIVNAPPIINKAHAASAPTQPPQADPPAPVVCDPLARETPLAPANDDLDSLRQQLDLDPDAPVDRVLFAAGRKIAELNEQQSRAQAKQKVRDALRAGKLVAAQQSWAEHLAGREPALFDEWLHTAPVVVPLGRCVPPDGTFSPRENAADAAARAEFRSHPLLASLTTEDAFVSDAKRHINRPAFRWAS